MTAKLLPLLHGNLLNTRLAARCESLSHKVLDELVSQQVPQGHKVTFVQEASTELKG